MSEDGPDDHPRISAPAAPDLARQSPWDHLANLAKAAVGAFPVAGGLLASLMSDYIPKSREAHLQNFLVLVAEGFENLTSEQQKTVQSDEFAHLFTKTFQSVGSEYRAEKIAAYRNLLLNFLVLDAPKTLRSLTCTAWTE